MSKILIIAEHDGQTLNPSTAKTLTCAAAIGGDIELAVFADSVDAVAAEAAALDGVSRVLTVSTTDNGFRLAAALAPSIAAMAEGYSHLLAPSTTFGKDLLPRVAALLGVAQVSDVMAVLGSHEFQRPIYAGNAIVNVSVPGDQIMAGTVRTASFAAAGGGGNAPIEAAGSAEAPAHTRFVQLEASGGERPDLQSATRVVSGGRALGSEESFDIIYQLADAMGAGVGASRAAVDAGYVPNDMQVGQTGKIIAPDLYLAIGISGAIQHLTGIKDAGTIVAINKDADAPIFEVADIGLVGDLFNIVPELTQKLGKRLQVSDDDPQRWLPQPQASPWRRLESRQVYENPWISLREDQVVHGSGEPGIYGVVEPIGLALGIVPLDENGYTWLVGQYRYTLGRYSWEIPEGGGDPKLDPVTEAARELREETGLSAASWRHLMTLHTSNCFTSERAEIYVARDLTPGPPQPDPTERLQLCHLPLDAAQALARQGTITDAMSVAALLKLAD